MALPLDQSIQRFIQNDARMDKFANGTELETYTTNTGVVVPSIQKFIKDKSLAVDANIVYIPEGIGAVPTTVQSKLRENGSVKDFGAVLDGVTDDSAAMTLAEVSSGKIIEIPKGQANTTLGPTALIKQYRGEGSIRFSSGETVSGIPSAVAKGKQSGFSGINAMTSTQQRAICIIGDSISSGSQTTTAQSYPALLQEYMGGLLTSPNPTFLSGSLVGQQGVTLSGSWAFGTSGPTGLSIILQAGAYIEFSSDYADFYGFWAQRSLTAGSIEIKIGTTVLRTVSCNGAALDNFFSGIGSFYRAEIGAASVCRLTAVTAAVDLTGIFAIPVTQPNARPIVLESRGGLATRDYITDAAINAVTQQVLDIAAGDPYPICIVALGTNDIYSSPPVSVTTFKTNLSLIVDKLLAKTFIPVLQVPLRSTLSPTSASTTFDDYRIAVYEIANKYRLDVNDLSELDLERYSAMAADHMHPNVVGQRILADKWIEFLKLSSIQRKTATTAIALTGGATTTVGLSVPSATIQPSGLVTLRGVVTVTGIVDGTVIGNMPSFASPSITRMMVGGTISPDGTARFSISSTGNLTLVARGTANYLCLDGLTYNIY